MVNGAVGADEDGTPRMVTTPWFDYEIPMTEAAEIGTKKVMDEHCSIGIVVTTDGTITDIPRSDYISAETRAIRDMKATGKPFLVIINSRNPGGEAAAAVRNHLRSEFSIPTVIADCQALDIGGIAGLLQELLYAFPMQELRVYLPRWMDALEPEHPVKAALYEALLQKAQQIASLGQAEMSLSSLQELEHVMDFSIRNVDLATGTVSCVLGFPETLFYEILSAKAGMDIQNDAQLISLLTDLSRIKQEYDKISDALSSVKATGYGIVMPTAEEMKLENPEILRKGGSFGVKLKAGAPSIHMIRVDIDTEINPLVGDEKQSMDLIDRLSNESPEKLWQSNIFGKSVYELIQEGLTSKLIRTPEDVRSKFRGSLTRIVNEGASGLICLIL
jgi:stage IV sporulation protein A